MKMLDEDLTALVDENDTTWVTVRLMLAVHEGCSDDARDSAGILVYRDDDSSGLFRASGSSPKECLLLLARRWEGLAKAIRLRAEEPVEFP